MMMYSLGPPEEPYRRSEALSRLQHPSSSSAFEGGGSGMGSRAGSPTSRLAYRSATPDSEEKALDGGGAGLSEIKGASLTPGDLGISRGGGLDRTETTMTNENEAAVARWRYGV